MTASIIPNRREGAARHGRIVMATFGSLGDVHPYLAIGLGLKERATTR